LAVRERVLPASDVDLAVAWLNLARVSGHLGQFTEALALAQKALALRQSALPASDPLVADAQLTLSALQAQLGNLPQAQSHFAAAAIGANAPATQKMAHLLAHAHVLQAQGLHTQAVAALSQRAQLALQWHGADHPAHTAAQLEHALALAAAGDLPQASQLAAGLAAAMQGFAPNGALFKSWAQLSRAQGTLKK
jgi:tetratricopeptide (TPR) repeat protein